MIFQSVELLGEYLIPPYLLSSLLFKWWTYKSIIRKYNIKSIRTIYQDDHESFLELKIKDLLFFHSYRYIRLKSLSQRIIHSEEFFSFSNLNITSKDDFIELLDKESVISCIFIILQKSDYKSIVYISFMIGSDKDKDIIEISRLLISDLIKLSKPKIQIKSKKKTIQKSQLPIIVPSKQESDPYFDPYIILDIPYGASIDEIKKAFRKKVKEFHPDMIDPGLNIRNDAIRRFLQIQAAYEYLMKIKDEFYTV